MNWNFTELLNLFSSHSKAKLLLDGTWGIERETPRVTSSGSLALTQHPEALGDKLDNPNITTDFSESQVELITDPYPDIEETYRALKELHTEVEKVIENEYLWPMSMPPKLPKEEDIPIAKFNDSKEGRKRTIYRKGLALRYGKKMQMICGLHYNFAFGEKIIDYLFQHYGQNKTKREFTDEIYFSVARNFLKYRWLLIYLFGASPVFHSSYKSAPDVNLEAATSLRVSPFGYNNIFHKEYFVTYNTLAEYIEDVRKLLTTKSERFSKLGIYREGEQVQLNDHILQDEGELYSFVRFKQNLGEEETQLEALEKRGVKYMEIRILDNNPFDPVGISINQLYFMQIFMLYCLLENSKPIPPEALQKADKNHDTVALYGRKQNLILEHYNNQPVTLQDWAEEIFEKLKKIAVYVDQASNNKKYESAINKEYEKIRDISKLPSSKICEGIKEYGDYLKFGMARAALNKINR
jgi:glutamate--cysteine ligase